MTWLIIGVIKLVQNSHLSSANFKFQIHLIVNLNANVTFGGSKPELGTSCIGSNKWLVEPKTHCIMLTAFVSNWGPVALFLEMTYLLPLLKLFNLYI